MFGLCIPVTISAQQDSGATASAEAPASSRRDDGRAQYPAWLANGFAAVNVGLIDYSFSDLQLEPGHQVGPISVPHVAVRAVLFGHQFGKYVSAQASYIRPVKYVKYTNVDGSGTTHTVWMHFGSLTLQSRVPIDDHFSVYGEGGLGITNRSGFDVDDVAIVKDAHFSSVLLGGGLEYRVNGTWDVVAGASYIPRRSRDRQPTTLFSSAGFRYTMRPLDAAQVDATRAAGFIFPEHVIQAGYATDAFGFRINNFVSKTVPIFWGGHVEVKRSRVTIQYQRNVFHTRKVFAIDIGVSASQWTSRNNAEAFRTVSIFPLLRFMVLRLRPADVYFAYSVAGPSYISRKVIDGLGTGGPFTFQDFMALGLFIGQNRHLNAEVNLNHYSNGNLLRENAGVKIPLTLKLGYAF